VRIRHFADPKTGMYRGKSVVKKAAAPKAKKKAVAKTAAKKKGKTVGSE
jgi:hypothetical protein